MTATQLEFAQYPSANPKSQAEREAILENPGFGNHFTDHTVVVDYAVDASGQGGCGSASRAADRLSRSALASGRKVQMESSAWR